MIAKTPAPPYYAVIFTRVKKDNLQEYNAMADLMERLASEQEGFLGLEYAGDKNGVTINYWKDEDSIQNWKKHSEHQIAQENGKTRWYECYKTRVCLVTRDYDFGI